MRRILIAVVLALTFAVTAFAAPIPIISCTTDSHSVKLVVDVNEKATKQVLKNIQKAFDNAAAQLKAEELLQYQGYVVFASGLSDADKEAIDSLIRPVVVGECK
jgi:hypothetical protein